VAAALLVALQLGGGATSTGRALDQIERSVTRPVPTTPPRPVERPPVWVPDRIISVPGQPEGVRVPGHWEHHYGDNRVLVPPLTVCNTQTGECRTEPGGVKPPVHDRPQTP
jgi:hypothetical protein